MRTDLRNYENRACRDQEQRRHFGSCSPRFISSRENAGSAWRYGDDVRVGLCQPSGIGPCAAGRRGDRPRDGEKNIGHMGVTPLSRRPAV